MNGQVVRGALIGACLGAGVGALYGALFVIYRQRLAAQAAREHDPEVIYGVPAGSELPEEGTADQRRGRSPEYRKVIERAKAIRAGQPDMRWQDAMRKAAENGRAPVEEPSSDPA